MKALNENIGFDEEYGECVFWHGLDEIAEYTRRFAERRK